MVPWVGAANIGVLWYHGSEETDWCLTCVGKITASVLSKLFIDIIGRQHTISDPQRSSLSKKRSQTTNASSRQDHITIFNVIKPCPTHTACRRSPPWSDSWMSPVCCTTSSCTCRRSRPLRRTDPGSETREITILIRQLVSFLQSSQCLLTNRNDLQNVGDATFINNYLS